MVLQKGVKGMTCAAVMYSYVQVGIAHSCIYESILVSLCFRVMSFVEVRFQNHISVHTKCVEGPTPAWNESITIPFIAPRGKKW